MLSIEDGWGSRLLLWAPKNRCLTTSLPPRLSPRSQEEARSGGLRVPLEPPNGTLRAQRTLPSSSPEKKRNRRRKLRRRKLKKRRKKRKKKEKPRRRRRKSRLKRKEEKEKKERKTQKEAAAAAKKAERAAKKADEEAKKVEKSKKTKEMKVDDPIPGPSNTRKSARSRK